MTSPTLSTAAGDGADASCRPSFDEHLQRAMRELRIALGRLLASVGADPRTPQKVSRRFGINRNLAWKVSRLISERDGLASVRHVPGKHGLQILCERFRDAGAPEDVLNAVGLAMDGFLQMVKMQAGDRAALEMTLRSLRPEGEGPAGMLAARKLAFQGNSAVWGVRAGLKLGLQVVAPSENSPGNRNVDIASVGGVMDFWRLRADACWPLMHSGESAASTASGPRFVEPLQASGGDCDGPPWIRDFCSVPLPECRRVERASGVLYEIADGPVGSTAAFSCVYGQLTRNAAGFAAGQEVAVPDQSLRLNLPVSAAHFDVLIHESLPVKETPRVVVESWMQMSDSPGSPEISRYRLDAQEEVDELPLGLPNLGIQEVPRYTDLVDQVVNALGHPLREFRGYRVKLRYPPIPAVLKLLCNSPEAARD